jgi:hypothetical protein
MTNNTDPDKLFSKARVHAKQDRQMTFNLKNKAHDSLRTVEGGQNYMPSLFWANVQYLNFYIHRLIGPQTRPQAFSFFARKDPNQEHKTANSWQTAQHQSQEQHHGRTQVLLSPVTQ